MVEFFFGMNGGSRMLNNSNNNRKISYSIVTNGVSTCSGSCSYCSAGSSMHYRMGINKHKIEEEVKRVIHQNEQEMRFDFNKLEETLDNDIKNIKHIDNTEGVSMSIDFWGADGLNNFIALQEEIAFFENFCQERGMILKPHTSTNGLPLILPEIYDYLLEHNIKFQLSHDGLGQHMRTDDFDPIKEVPLLRESIKNGTCDWINTTLNFWNPSLENNRQYWLTHLQDIFPAVFDNNQECTNEEDTIYRALFIKLNHIYNGDYDILALNKYGWFNGKQYDQLKTAPYGNVKLHNDKELAGKYNIPELAHVLDDYIAEWYNVYNILSNKNVNNDPYWLPFRGYLQSQMNRFDILKRDENGNVSSGACHDFQAGIKDTTFVIDTTGRYSQCNLIDADHKVLNETARQPEYCKTCKYKDSRECNACGSVDYPKNCEYLYRWNQFLEYVKKDKSNKSRGSHVTSCNSQKRCNRPQNKAGNYQSRF